MSCFQVSCAECPSRFEDLKTLLTTYSLPFPLAITALKLHIGFLADWNQSAKQEVFPKASARLSLSHKQLNSPLFVLPFLYCCCNSVSLQERNTQCIYTRKI